MKDKSITDVVRWLEENLGCDLLAVDHWDADLFAIGIAPVERPRRVVYISKFGCSPDRYFAELEDTPPEGSDLPYACLGRRAEVNREALLGIVREHLRLPIS